MVEAQGRIQKRVIMRETRADNRHVLEVPVRVAHLLCLCISTRRAMLNRSPQLLTSLCVVDEEPSVVSRIVALLYGQLDVAIKRQHIFARSASVSRLTWLRQWNLTYSPGYFASLLDCGRWTPFTVIWLSARIPHQASLHQSPTGIHRYEYCSIACLNIWKNIKESCHSQLLQSEIVQKPPPLPPSPCPLPRITAGINMQRYCASCSIERKWRRVGFGNLIPLRTVLRPWQRLSMRLPNPIDPNLDYKSIRRVICRALKIAVE